MKRVILWLARVFDVNLVEQARLKNGAGAIERGQRWEQFYREEGGLADMIAKLRLAYFRAASEVGHRDDDKLYEFAVADRLARELDREVQQIIVNGRAEVERHRMAERDEAARILRAI